MKPFYATANSFSYTKEEYLHEKVTASSSATSTRSYDDALKIAEKIANSIAKNDANIINQTLDISTKLFSNNNNNIQPLIGLDGNIYACKQTGDIKCMYSDYTFNWSCNLNKTISSAPVFDSNGNLNIVTNDFYFYVINKYNGSFIQTINLNSI
jgi:hypothetical protein